MSQPSAYQKVTDQYNVTEAGVSSVSYLFFDGVNDSLATPSINFTSTDKMTVFAGVRKLSDAAAAILVESSTNVSPVAGAFYLTAPEGSGIEYSSLSKGNIVINTNQRADFDAASAVAPVTSVISATHDIAADLSTIRHNGVSGVNGTGDKGTGNFLAYPLYIGARAGTSAFFSGHLYSLIVRGAQSNTGQISSTETWVASKTGITI